MKLITALIQPEKFDDTRLIPKVRLEILADADRAEGIIDLIIATANTASAG